MSGLIDGLHDTVALTCLALVPYYLYSRLELVSRSWRATLRSVELFRVRQKFGLSEDFLVVCRPSEGIWQLYDPVHKLWIALTKFPSETKILHFGVVSTSQKIFVIGGQTGFVDTVTTDEVWSFDLVTRTWSMLAPMLVSRALFACCFVDGKIVVAGGFTTSRFKFTSKAEMYDIEKDVWIPLPNLLCVHDGYCRGLMIGGKMHIDYNFFVQVFDSLELKWRVADYKWISGQKVVIRDSLYVKVLIPLTGYIIIKEDGQEDRRVVSSPRYFPGIPMHMIGFRGELYMFGIISEGRIDLLDVHVLNVGDENPTWHYSTPMSRQRNGLYSTPMSRQRNGLVYGCTELRI